MLRKFFLVVIFLALPSAVFAQDFPIHKDEFYKAEVMQILEEGEKRYGEIVNPYQLIRLKLLDKDEEIEVEHGSTFRLQDRTRVRVNDKVVVLKSTDAVGNFQYYVVDKYRLDNIIFPLLLFFIFVLGIARLKGLGSIIGLVVSLIVILKFIVPRIVNGQDPVITSIIGSIGIMFVTIYLSHGFSRKTTTALISTVLALSLTGILAALFVNFVKLTGMGSETAYGLTFGFQNVNLQGILLGGIIIGALGVLDDVTTTQSAAIFELKKANPALKFAELFKRGMNVGKEHISSLVNTLFLAYTGASLPVLMILSLNPSEQPLWLLLNNESILEEVVRTLAGSAGLVLAVPITTVIAAWVAGKRLKPH